jgi:hypothetical protein
VAGYLAHQEFTWLVYCEPLTDEAIQAELDQSRRALFRLRQSSRQVLVLLDNVWDEQQVRPLLVEADTSTTLLVSRKRLLGLRDVRRLQVTPLSRADSIAMMMAALLPSVTAEPDDLDRLAEFCGDLPLALDIALRRIALRPRVVLRQILDSWHQDGNALNWLCIGDLSMRESLRSAYLTLSQPAQIQLHELARSTADDVGLLLSEEDELADELIDAGILAHASYEFAGVHLSPLVRAFILDMAASMAHDLPVVTGYLSSTDQKPRCHRTRMGAALLKWRDHAADWVWLRSSSRLSGRPGTG